MANKFFNCLVWVFIVLIVLGMLWLIAEPIIWWTEYSEARLYIRIFLIMFAASTFAILRLYNSIVQNTRFSLKLRDAIVKLQQTFPSLERVMRSLSGTLGNVKSSSDALKKEISENSDKVDKLIDTIKRKQ